MDVVIVFKKKTEKFTYYLILFLLIILVYFNFYAAIKNYHLDERIVFYQEQNNQLRKENKILMEEWDNLRKEFLKQYYKNCYINMKLDYIESKLNSRISYEFYFSEIQKMTPTTVQIDQISVKGNSIQIVCTAGNYSDIGYFTKELMLSELFTNVDYDFEIKDTVTGDYIVRNLICYIDLTF